VDRITRKGGQTLREDRGGIFSPVHTRSRDSEQSSGQAHLSI